MLIEDTTHILRDFPNVIIDQKKYICVFPSKWQPPLPLPHTFKFRHINLFAFSKRHVPYTRLSRPSKLRTYSFRRPNILTPTTHKATSSHHQHPQQPNFTINIQNLCINKSRNCTIATLQREPSPAEWRHARAFGLRRQYSGAFGPSARRHWPESAGGRGGGGLRRPLIGRRWR